MDERPLNATKPPNQRRVPADRATTAPTGWLTGGLAFLFGTAAVLSIAAFGGRWIWQLDLLTHFRLHYVAVLGIGAAALLFTNHRWATVLVAGALVVNVVAVAPLFIPAGGDSPHGASLRVLSFNVKGFATDPEPVLEFLRATDAEVVFLHEANIEWEEHLDDAGLPFQLAFPRREGSIFGTAVLYRSAVDARGLVLGPDQRVAIEVTLDHDGTRVKLLGIHAYAPVSKFYSDTRDRQFSDVEAWAQNAGMPAIVVGDFNATQWSHAFPDDGLLNTARGEGFQPTWPASLEPLGIPIDNAVVTKEWVTVRRWLGPDLGSDHYPLFLDLALKFDGS